MSHDAPLRAYSVKRLAEAWGCPPKQIYTLINDGLLQAFKIGKKRGLRVSAEEVQRWERENGSRSLTGPEDARSGGAKANTLPTSAMKVLASAGE